MSPTMSSSPFLSPLRGPSRYTFSSTQSPKTAALQQLGGRGRCQTEQRQHDKVTMVRQKLDNTVVKEEKKHAAFDHYFRDIRHQLSIQPEFWYISTDVSQKPPPQLDEDLFVNSPLTMVRSHGGDENELDNVRWLNALLLAKEAMLASKEAAALAGFDDFTDADATASRLPSLDEPAAIEKTIVRSGRLLERRSRKRTVLQQNSSSHKYCSSITTQKNKKVSKALISNDPLDIFLRCPETKRLLTIKEERDLFSQAEELMKVEEVKQKLHLQFGHEPTLIEWAEAVGMSHHELQLCLFSGECSRDKLIYANLRLVVHIAKNYQGNGLSLQDLYQAGSLGLMKALEKFKPKLGCRFSSYAYWWIRQSIKKAIFQDSRLIRLPEHVFTLLKKIKSKRMSCIQQGHYPSNLDLAKLVGISVKKLERLLFLSRNPVSIQKRVWADQDVTIQEITPDPSVETPDIYVTKLFMRQHVRNLLGVLPPRERQIICLRYGLHDGEPKVPEDIGNLCGLSKERVRQLEIRAMDKLRRCATDQGLEEYLCLLT